MSGVCGYSTVAGQSRYVIFSVGNDLIRPMQFRTWAGYNLIGFKSLVGMYKGVSEQSFIINAKDQDACRRWFAGQDTILALSPANARNHRQAHLVDITADGYSLDYVDLGLFKAVTKNKALKLEAWTFDPQGSFQNPEGQYYITEK